MDVIFTALQNQNPTVASWWESQRQGKGKQTGEKTRFRATSSPTLIAETPKRYSYLSEHVQEKPGHLFPDAPVALLLYPLVIQVLPDGIRQKGCVLFRLVGGREHDPSFDGLLDAELFVEQNEGDNG